MVKSMIAAGMTEDNDYWSKECFIGKESIRFHIACDAHEDLIPRNLEESCRVICQNMDFVDVGQFQFGTVSDALIFLTFFNNTQINNFPQQTTTDSK